VRRLVDIVRKLSNQPLSVVVMIGFPQALKPDQFDNPGFFGEFHFSKQEH
jgi:hypothetical protein